MERDRATGFLATFNNRESTDIASPQVSPMWGMASRQCGTSFCYCSVFPRKEAKSVGTQKVVKVI